MKRIFPLMLLGLVVVFVAVAGYFLTIRAGLPTCA